MNAEELWDDFIKQLNEDRPLGKLGEHKAFIGSIDAYRAIFLKANEHKFQKPLDGKDVK